MTSKIHRSVLGLAAIGALAGMPMLNGLAFAGDKHVAEAVEHARGAASHGKEGHADACTEHASEALKHAQAAGMKNPHLAEGVKHLTEAVQHGKAGHADACTEHANGAATHLAEVK
jgi:Small metal-binding protein